MESASWIKCESEVAVTYVSLQFLRGWRYTDNSRRREYGRNADRSG